MLRWPPPWLPSRLPPRLKETLVLTKLLKHKYFFVLLAVLALMVLVSCNKSDPQSTFDPAGPVASKQLDLFWIIFWAAVVVFVIVEGILVFAVVRYARRRGDDRMPAQTHGSLPLEIGWTIAPAIVLAVIAVPTVYYIFDISAEPTGDVLTVNVTGHQWWWEFEYPEQNLITANELHVPVDTPVKLNLRSDDVIHSFWIPKLAGKVDVIPANENKMKFTSNETGEFYGQCAEFCGVAHAHMRFRVIVEEDVEFEAWVEQYHDLAARPMPTGDSEEAKGALVFASRGCLLCHTVSGPAPEAVRQSLKESFERGELRFPAPNLTNFGTRGTLAAAILDNDVGGENLREWLRDPDDVKEGNRMAQLATVYNDPDSKLSELEISQLAAYLLSLR